MSNPAWSPSKIPDVSEPVLSGSTVPPSGAVIAPGGIATAEAFGTSVITVSTFDGDFGALFADFGLTVDGYYRTDLGLTGTVGTGKASMANQMGTMGPVLASAAPFATNGIGTPGAGLNGHASLISDASLTQGGRYTSPAGPLPATTNVHVWEIFKILNPGGFGFNSLWESNAGSYKLERDYSGTAHMTASMNGYFMYATSTVANQWYRSRFSAVGGGANADQFRIGAEDATPIIASNIAYGTQWSWACAISDVAPNATRVEYLCRLHVRGPLATFLTAAAAADTAARSFWTTAIEI